MYLILLFYKSSGFLESSPEAGQLICEVLQPLFNGSQIFPVGHYHLFKFSQPFSIWLNLSQITLKSSPPVTCDGPPTLWQPSDTVTEYNYFILCIETHATHVYFNALFLVFLPCLKLIQIRVWLPPGSRISPLNKFRSPPCQSWEMHSHFKSIKSLYETHKLTKHTLHQHIWATHW